MFREMVRKNKAINKEEITEILKSEKRGVLSVIGDEGYPYGMPMNHYYNEEDGCIYFHSGKEGHRTDSIKNNNKASFCLYTKGYKEENDWALNIKSVIAFGKIEIIDDMKLIKSISRKLSYKFTSDNEYIEKEIAAYAEMTILLKMEIEHIEGKLIKES